MFARRAGGDGLNALHERPAMLELIGDVAGREVLDLGAGAGHYSVELAQRGANVLAVEGGAGLVQHARDLAEQHRVSGAVRVIQHNLEEPLSFIKAGTIDIAICALVLHHISNRSSLLSEIRRVLRPRAEFVVSTTHPVADWGKFGGSYFDARWVDRPIGSNGEHIQYRFAPVADLVNELIGSGFRLLEMREPQPTAQLREVDPVKYEQLMNAPAFMAMRLQRD